jgi:hypothetical protein
MNHDEFSGCPALQNSCAWTSMVIRAVLENLGKTRAKNRPRIGSKSGVEGCKSRRINNKLD